MQLPVAHHENPVFLPFFDLQHLILKHSHELDDIFRIMLTVAVDGHGIVEPHLNGLAETRAQSMSLASVVLVADKSD